jgi:FlaA1/EpsC-like NDP-sugar epimerase
MGLATSLAPHIVTCFKVATRPALTKLCLALADATALLVSVGVSILAKAAFAPNVHVASYLQLWPFLFAFLIVYKAIGLYSIVALPAEEIVYSSGASAIVFVLLAIVTSSFRAAQHQLTWTLLLALGISVGMLPLFRSVVRRTFAARNWWGHPAIVFGAGRMAEDIVATMAELPGLGLKAVALIDERKSGGQVLGIPVLRSFEHVLPWLGGCRPYAVFATEDLSAHDPAKLADRYRAHFSHILIVPNLKGIRTGRAVSKNLNGLLGLEMPGL